MINARTYLHKIRNEIQLSFKTFAAEGLLFLYGNATTYIALEMRDGKVFFKVDQFSQGLFQNELIICLVYSTISVTELKSSNPPRPTTTGIGIALKRNETVSMAGYTSMQRRYATKAAISEATLSAIRIISTSAVMSRCTITPISPIKASTVVLTTSTLEIRLI